MYPNDEELENSTMYPNDEDLENSIKYHSNLVLFLTELKERRLKEETLNFHKPSFWDKKIYTRKGVQLNGFFSVTCACGHNIKYKKPLNHLDDFICPRKGK